MQTFKRILDVALALVIIAFGWPILLLIAVLVRLKLGSPVLFRQARAGHRGKAFDVIKFRSMTDQRDTNGELLPDEIRLTTFGKLLRASSLDELPEIINVLKGEMSFVGPRPLLLKYLDRYTPEQNRRHEVLPGITGWAQVNGRNAISWEEKFRLDVWYVDNHTLMLDLMILWLTLGKVVKRSGISAADQATVSEFTGSAQ